MITCHRLLRCILGGMNGSCRVRSTLCYLVVSSELGLLLVLPPLPPELNRYSIKAATLRDKAAVQQCYELCDAVQGEFLQVNTVLPRVCVHVCVRAHGRRMPATPVAGRVHQGIKPACPPSLSSPIPPTHHTLLLVNY